MAKSDSSIRVDTGTLFDYSKTLFDYSKNVYSVAQGFGSSAIAKSGFSSAADATTEAYANDASMVCRPLGSGIPDGTPNMLPEAADFWTGPHENALTGLNQFTDLTSQSVQSISAAAGTAAYQYDKTDDLSAITVKDINTKVFLGADDHGKGTMQQLFAQSAKQAGTPKKH